MKCKEILQSAKSRLKACGILGFDSDAEFLLAHVLGVGRGDIRLEDEVTQAVIQDYYDLIARRECHEPMDSLIGFTEFMGLKIPFSVNTLTPRQETEIMTDDIVRASRGKRHLDILDMCTGSGCIGLALRKHLNCRVTLADISTDALRECEKNAKINGLECNIVHSNLFENIAGTFDIIVSNPPYIQTGDLFGLEKEVLDFDPKLALDGGDDGLDFYRKIAMNAPKFLKDNGLIYLEFGIGQGKEIEKMMSEWFEDIQIVKDYSGLDRYIKGKKKEC